MKYTLEIQKLLLQAQNKNLHPREKANLLKEAIRIADENEDVEWATEMRLDLIYELNLLSADTEEIAVFSKILDDYENHKDVIKEDDLLWKYKWIWSSTFDIPEIPMEQVEAVGEDYKTRILRNGYSLRSYYQRWSVECTWMRQVRRIAGAQGWLVVNAAYTFDETLLKKYARLNPELTLDEISPSRLLEQFGEVEAKKEFRAFEAKANELLKRFGCVCRLKHFTPADIPVIFVAEEKESTTKSTNNPLAAVLGTVNTTRQIPPTLTFNADNEMVRTLLQIQGDNKMFQHVVHILYVQSLLQGKYPVNSEEMELFNHSLSELMTAKMNDFINFLN